MTNDESVEHSSSNPQSSHDILRYTVTWDDGWKSAMEGTSLKRLKQKVDGKTPDKRFIEALDACRKKFYPDVDQAPWDIHKRKDTRSDINDWIDSEAGSTWQLDWYWRTLVTDLLPEFVSSEWDTIYVKLSQVRQWLMLAAYHERHDRRQLIRPPIFGRSSRLTDTDQYWLYLDNEQIITETWEQLSDSHISEDKSYLMGRHDVIYEINFSNIDISNGEINVGVKGKLNLFTHKQRTRLNVLGGDYKEVGPYDLVSIPTFGNGDTTTTEESGEDNGQQSNVTYDGDNQQYIDSETFEILVSSDEVCRVTEVLSSIWNDPTHKSLHINAPPGSGKEVLHQTLHKFKDATGSSETTVWTPGSPDLNMSMLFGGKDSEGLIKQCDGGTLILDEIDKVDARTRSSLLRVIENGEYVVPGEGVKKLEDEEIPFFVLLSSKPLNEVSNLEPPDLWSRIELTIDMSHPLDIVDFRERIRVIREYFLLFWNAHVTNFVDKKGLTTYSDSTPVVGDFVKKVCELFLCSSFSRTLAGTFARAANNRQKNMNIRDIRTATERCVFNAIRMFVYNPSAGVHGGLNIPDERVALVDRLLDNPPTEHDSVSPDTLRIMESIVEASLGGRAMHYES